MKKLHALSLSSLMLCAAGAAHADQDSLRIKFVSTELGAKVSVDDTAPKASYSGIAGKMKFEQDVPGPNPSFYAYCVEIGQHASTSFQTYTKTKFVADQEKYLQGLFSASSLYTGDKKIDTGLEQAAFQVAIWEITHEKLGNSLDARAYVKSGGSWYENAAKGEFFVTKFNDTGYLPAGSNTSSFVNTVNGYLADAKGYATDLSKKNLFTVSRLSNGSYQDYVVASKVTSPVPEPSTYAMLAAGLLAVWGLRRRQQVR